MQNVLTVCAQCQHPDQSGLSLLLLNGISRVAHMKAAMKRGKQNLTTHGYYKKFLSGYLLYIF